ASKTRKVGYWWKRLTKRRLQAYFHKLQNKERDRDIVLGDMELFNRDFWSTHKASMEWQTSPLMSFLQKMPKEWRSMRNKMVPLYKNKGDI
ncbi:hypothetical protein H5410_015170, partial [Solanum commersonii]